MFLSYWNTTQCHQSKLQETRVYQGGSHFSKTNNNCNITQHLMCTSLWETSFKCLGISQPCWPHQFEMDCTDNICTVEIWNNDKSKLSCLKFQVLSMHWQPLCSGCSNIHFIGSKFQTRSRYLRSKFLIISSLYFFWIQKCWLESKAIISSVLRRVHFRKSN